MRTRLEGRIERLEQVSGAGEKAVELFGVQTTQAEIARIVGQAQGARIPVVREVQEDEPSTAV